MVRTAGQEEFYMTSINAENIARIKKISARLRFICTGIFYILPILAMSYWFFYNGLPDAWRSGLVRQYSREPELSFLTRFLCMIVEIIPVTMIMLSTSYLINLFALYEKKVFFSEENVGYIMKLGKVAIIWSFMDILKQTLYVLALTLPNPPGQRILVIGFGSSQLMMLLVGYIVVLFARVVDEARIISDEQQLTI